ncbi:MAG: Hsp20/alpha crystallin family protein [Leptolyngbyaceae cyanobacterium]
MIVRYWQPFQELEAIRQQLDSVFETPAAETMTPAVDLVDNGDSYTVEVVLPGVNADAINIEASRKSIAISGERTAPDYDDTHKVLHRERRYGTFRRVVGLPAAVDHENIKADYSNGILTLQAPKTAEELNKIVKVNIAGTLPETAE